MFPPFHVLIICSWNEEGKEETHQHCSDILRAAYVVSSCFATNTVPLSEEIPVTTRIFPGKYEKQTCI